MTTNTNTDDSSAVRFYELAHEFKDRFGWSFAKIARDGLNIPSQWLYRYFARARVALGEEPTMQGDRSPSKGTVRALELLTELHEAQATIAKLNESVTKLATTDDDEALAAAKAEAAELRERLAASYRQWSVKNLRAECARRGLKGKAGDVLDSYVARLVADDEG